MKTCAGCGKTFKGTQRRCQACRSVERACTQCGDVFKGTHRRCAACQRTERACTECGRLFKSHQRVCQACRQTERACVECGRAFKSHRRTCSACRTAERTCAECGQVFKGEHLRCEACQATERTCIKCSRAFKGTKRRCPACRGTERTCTGCGQVFRGTNLRCMACQWQALPAEVRQAKRARDNNARRARLYTAGAGDHVPVEVYEAIRASGPCVYCAAPAEHVDHVRPLARGGREHESNFVPACAPCNYSKGDRLLTDWHRSDRVAHGVAHSPKVAAELARLTAVASSDHAKETADA